MVKVNHCQVFLSLFSILFPLLKVLNNFFLWGPQEALRNILSNCLLWSAKDQNFVIKVILLSSSCKLSQTDANRLSQQNRKNVPKSPYLDKLLEYLPKAKTCSEQLKYEINLMLYLQSPTTKIRLLFDLFDFNKDGFLSQDELKYVIESAMKKSSMKMNRDLINELSGNLVSEVVEKYRNKGVTDLIHVDSFMNYIREEETLQEMIVNNINRSIVPKEIKKQRSELVDAVVHFTSPEYLQNNGSNIITVSTFLGALLASMYIRGAQFMDARTPSGHTNILLIVARACGQGINLCFFFVILLMCRPLITFLRYVSPSDNLITYNLALRRFGVHKYIPLDQHVSYHKGCAMILSLLSLVHTVVHLINLDLNVVTSPDLNTSNFTYSEWLTTTVTQKLGTFPGFGYPTGLSLIIVLGKLKFQEV